MTAPADREIGLEKLVGTLDSELRTSELPDFGGAWNGLQIANQSGRVRKLAAAVDASLPVFRKAVDAGADLLLVHHGMFWQGVQPLTGSVFEKIKLALDHDLAVYSSHLPLDAHPCLGNNAGLASALGADLPIHPGTANDGSRFAGGWEPCLEYKGLSIGLKADVEIPLEELLKRVRDAVGGPVHCCAAGPNPVRRLAVATGGAGSEVGRLPSERIDTLITGEGPHWTYPLAEELGVNLIYAGHYATETFGVRALAEWVAGRYALDWRFIDHPTGL